MTSNYGHIVIGAGVIGTATAYWLARSGAKNVLVLEQFGLGHGKGASEDHLTATDIRRQWPQWQIEDDVLGMFQHDGGILDVRTACAAQIAAARTRGVESSPLTTVLDMSSSANRVTMTTDRGVFTAGPAVDVPVAALPVPYRTHAAEPTFQSLHDPQRPGPQRPGPRAFPVALDPFTCTRDDIADFTRAAQDLGVRYVGVCCGAGPHHIRAMAEALGRTPPASRYSADMSKHAFLAAASSRTPTIPVATRPVGCRKSAPYLVMPNIANATYVHRLCEACRPRRLRHRVVGAQAGPLNTVLTNGSAGTVPRSPPR